MQTSQNENQRTPDDGTAFSTWGLLGGAIVGLVIGLATRHWPMWACGLGVVGWVTGALLDRARLK